MYLHGMRYKLGYVPRPDRNISRSPSDPRIRALQRFKQAAVLVSEAAPDAHRKHRPQHIVQTAKDDLEGGHPFLQQQHIIDTISDEDRA
jgi:hypothetical protein